MSDKATAAAVQGNQAFETQLLEHAQRVTSRPIYTFTLPPDIAKASGLKTIGLIELNAGEEMNATRRARNEPIRLAAELPMESLRMADSAKLSMSDGTAEKVWEALGPQGRSLVIMAYGELHTPDERLIDSFMKSRTVNVG